MSATKTRRNAVPRLYAGSRRGSALPAVFVLIVLSVAGFFGWKAFEKYQTAKQGEREAIRAENERIRAEKARRGNVEDEPKPKTKPEEEVVELPPLQELPPEPPKKPEAEILREEETLRKSVWAQIEEARKKDDVAPLGDYADVKFGEPGQPFASANPVKWERRSRNRLETPWRRAAWRSPYTGRNPSSRSGRNRSYG